MFVHMMPLGSRLAPPRGSQILTQENRRQNSKFFFSVHGKVQSFGMQHRLVDLYQFYSYDTPGVKTGPDPGVTNWNNSNKEGRIHCVGKVTQVSDPGPSWPSCSSFREIYITSRSLQVILQLFVCYHFPPYA